MNKLKNLRIISKKILVVILSTAVLLSTGIVVSNLVASAAYAMSPDPNEIQSNYQAIKVGIISDIHLYDTETSADTNLKKILTQYKDRGTDAVIITGDVGNTGSVKQYDKFKAIWNSVFTDAATAPKRLMVMGNHDYESVINSEHNTVEQAQQRFKTAFGNDLNFNVVIKGYHFIGMSGEGSAVHGNFTSATMDWLKQQLDAAVNENPNMPIYVMAHQPVSNTTYGSEWGGNPAFADLLKNYPQVVYFAGHAHYPLEDERCIYQKDFTAVDVPSLQYMSVETGTPDRAFESQEALLMEVKGGVNKINLERIKIQTMSPLKEDWVLDLPLSTNTFQYTDARKNSRVAPAFASGAQVTASKITSNSCTISFPSASHGDYVQGYNVKVVDKATGKEYSKKYFVTDFFVDLKNMATTQSTDLKGLLSNTEYTVQVTALEAFGFESQPISCDFQTFAVNAASDGVPRADILDVDFHVGFMDNSPYRTPYTLYSDGFHPAIVFDASLKRNVLQILPENRWVNYPTNSSLISKIKNTVTMEVAFKATDLNGTHCVMANLQSGGIGMEMADGLMEVWIKFADGYKHFGFKVTDTNKYYHVIASYDGKSIKLYVDGQLVEEQAASGSIDYNPDMDIFTIGANPVVGGNAADKFTGNIALARVYSFGLNENDVNKAYEYFTHDPQYVAVYKNTTILKNLDVNNDNYFISAETLDAIKKMIVKGSEIDADANISQEQANQFVIESNKVIAKFFEEAGIPNPNIPTPTTTESSGTTTTTTEMTTESETSSTQSTTSSTDSTTTSTTSTTITTNSTSDTATSTSETITTLPTSTVSGTTSTKSNTAYSSGASDPVIESIPPETTNTIVASSPQTGNSGINALFILILAVFSSGTVFVFRKQKKARGK